MISRGLWNYSRYGIQSFVLRNPLNLVVMQSSLLKYWEFNPYEEEDRKTEARKEEEKHGLSSKTRVDPSCVNGKRETNGFRNLLHLRSKYEDQGKKKQCLAEHEGESEKEAEKRKRPVKKMPVCFLIPFKMVDFLILT